ncbi:MAG: hypothetical protein UU65_C0001G0222 [candidate division CPR2 bacterium GW2011_GWC1_41_48]|uniref:Uncharacterized protein n=1 Tax=candidate division CPR2 bacterium GW2011_GWC1_41_48 TaxID=1618344 RepID=A0A0G0WCN2_UNCC2|nr:MAG: hypothetical protein UT47_C0001G0222 [candidate division CPR2 bacterium GW2011_GWC2_39_35]KKR28125.1 MAG: hypothetical protein UT60_C0027G0015 [candidate division CPR2 bacterium GW2011_GWD2_39_7]KKR29550.1 MAG: hypothetical protein UT59_C0005G0005 [candidate division CPR2 bacterium GW2011_GWD1_39_7]KKS09817.1 MAG: hypothetical protein UU65_C0001G0222 [candidate division CPR2 bacterium GW2011_GWC1_41_48]
MGKDRRGIGEPKRDCILLNSQKKPVETNISMARAIKRKGKHGDFKIRHTGVALS